MKMSNIRIVFRLMAVVALGALGLLVFGFIALQGIRSQLISERETKTSEQIENVLSLIVHQAKDAAQAGKSKEQAQQEILRTVSALRYSGNQYFWVNSITGQMLMHPANPKLVGTSILELKDADGKRAFAGMIDLVRSQGKGYYRYWWQTSTDPAPREKISYVASYPEWDWVVGTGIYIDDVDVAFWETVRRLGLIGVVILALTAVCALFITRSVVSPLGVMTRRMHDLAQGQLDGEVPYTAQQDEIGLMAKALQVLKTNSLEQVRLQSEQAAERAAKERRTQALERLIQDFDRTVSGVLGGVASASSELSKTAESMAELAQQANRQASASAVAAEQTSANVQTAASATEEMAASIQEIAQQVSRSNAIAAQAVGEAQRTTGSVRELAQAVGRIDEVVKLIQDIASQTNLLALNATIEAARAGDAGKGFAVVAGEVKALANQTGKATEDIAAQIAAVQAATQGTVSAIEGIGNTITTINEIASAIAAAIEEQNATTGEITRNVQQAAHGTEEVSGNIVQVNQAATQTGAAANQVLGASGALSRQAEELRREVESFLAGIRAA